MSTKQERARVETRVPKGTGEQQQQHIKKMKPIILPRRKSECIAKGNCMQCMQKNDTKERWKPFPTSPCKFD